MLIYVLIIAAISCTVIGNLLLKIGAGKPGIFDIWPLNIINLYVIGGIISFATGLLFYTLVLKKLPLNIAQSIFSVQFVFVILAANFFLDEPIQLLRWVGIAIVAIGLFVISLTV
jgi:multidrug transporter EmrE-like cation transporter